ncbi:hypothetical protein M0804_013215 [Polistes exclamans]|nr:hypothetical protein M0804_013215 [Polistes exclamans]
MHSSMSEISESKLIRRRAVLKSRLTSFKKLINGLDTPNQDEIAMVMLKLKDIESDMLAFENIQSELVERASDESVEDRIQEGEDYRDAALNAKIKAERIIAKFNELTIQTTDSPVSLSTVNASSLANNTPNNDNNLKLPAMRLPQFDGRFEDWPNFADQFQSIIGQKTELPNIQKFSYLKVCVSGKAENKIRALETTGDNYQVAWNILEEYYDNPLVLIHKHIKAIQDCPRTNRQSPQSLIDASDALCTNYHSLVSTKKSYFEAFPIHMVVARGLALLHSQPERAFKNTEKIRVNNLPKPFSRYPNPQNKSQVYSTQIRYRCSLCKNNHYTSECDQLVKAKPEERRKIIERAGLCTNCLRHNHKVEACQAGSCRKCKGRHNTLLHVEEEDTTIKCAHLKLDRVPLPTLLLTAVVSLLYRDGKPHKCRVLLDSGAEANFLKLEFASKLRIPKQTFYWSFYQQMDSSSLGNPASPVLANLVMNYILKKIEGRLHFLVPFLKVNVDDVVTVIPKDRID